MSQEITLVGVLDDGTERAPWLPTDTATTRHMPSGGDVNVRVPVFYGSGVAVPLAALPGGFRGLLTFDCGVDPCARLAELQYTATAGELPHELLFAVPAGAFRGKMPGRYLFDVWLEQLTPKRRWQVVGLGAWIVDAALTRP